MPHFPPPSSLSESSSTATRLATSPTMSHSPIRNQHSSTSVFSATDDDDRTERQPRRAKAGHGGSRNPSPTSVAPRRSSTLEERRIASGHRTPHGYGATGQGLGLGLSDVHRIRGDRTPLSRDRGEDGQARGPLASPRRISTSSTVPPMPQTAAPAPRHASHHYTEPRTSLPMTQPSSASTPRFRGTHIAGHHTPSTSAQMNNSFLNPSTHRRKGSVQSALQSPRIPKSPGGTMMRTIRKTASMAGISLGRPATYDRQDADEASDDEEEPRDDEAERRNGLRVWYRYVCIRALQGGR